MARLLTNPMLLFVYGFFRALEILRTPNFRANLMRSFVNGHYPEFAFYLRDKLYELNRQDLIQSSQIPYQIVAIDNLLAVFEEVELTQLKPSHRKFIFQDVLSIVLTLIYEIVKRNSR